MLNSEKIKIRARYALLIAIFLLAGLGSGFMLGKDMLRKILFNENNSVALLFQPANDFFTVYSFVNSEDGMKRLSGYYSFLESKYINDDFLIQRYAVEKSFIIKRTIIWLLGFSQGDGRVVRFFLESYPKSSAGLKQQILSSLYRSDRNAYGEFIEKNKIKNSLQGIEH